MNRIEEVLSHYFEKLEVHLPITRDFLNVALGQFLLSRLRTRILDLETRAIAFTPFSIWGKMSQSSLFYHFRIG